MHKQALALATLILSSILLAPAASSHEPKAIAVTIYYSKDGHSDATLFKIDEIFSNVDECISHIRSSGNMVALAFNSNLADNSTVTHVNLACHQNTGRDWTVLESVQVGNLDGRWQVVDLDSLIRNGR